MKGVLTTRRGDGVYLDQAFDVPGGFVADQINATGHAWQQQGYTIQPSWNGAPQPYRFGKGWRMDSTRPREAFEVVETNDLGLVRGATVGSGQSNLVGRGLKGDVPRDAAALIVKWSPYIWPNKHPYMEVGDGPGLNQVVGPMLMHAALIMEYTTVFDRWTLYCLGKGNTSLDDHFFTAEGGGQDVIQTRVDHMEIMGGSETYNPPGFPRSTDRYIVMFDIGERDAALGTTASEYWSKISRNFGSIQGNMGQAQYTGIINLGLCPTNRSGTATQAQWDAVRQGQLDWGSSYSDVGTVFAQDSDSRVDDLIHRSSPGTWRLVREALTLQVNVLGHQLGITSEAIALMNAGRLANGDLFSTIDHLADQFDFGT